MNSFDTALILTRVMVSGTIMSIEKNEKELPALEALLAKLTGFRHVSLFNSVTGAYHGALWGLGLAHGSRTPLSPAGERESRFAAWLGLEITPGVGRPYERLEIGFADRGLLRGLSARLPGATPAVIDLTPLGFGPCAAFVTDDELAWKRAERLKIFGSFDLRTMWTQQEQSADLQVGVQFNYRLSPLVGACARLALLQPEETAAAAAPVTNKEGVLSC